jgi:hypothetical protein
MGQKNAADGSRKPAPVPMGVAMLSITALEPVMFSGLSAVAIWVYVRFPARRPSSLVRAALRVGWAFTLFYLAPIGLRACVGNLPGDAGVAVFLVAVLIPTLGFVLVSWLWFVARIVEELGGPRGGHRVRKRLPGRHAAQLS